MTAALLTLGILTTIGLALLLFRVAANWPWSRPSWRWWFEYVDELSGLLGPVSSSKAEAIREASAAFVAFRSAAIAGVFTVLAATIAGLFAIATSTIEANAEEPVPGQGSPVASRAGVSNAELLEVWKRSEYYQDLLPKVREAAIASCDAGPVVSPPEEAEADLRRLVVAAAAFGCDIPVSDEPVACGWVFKAIRSASVCSMSNSE